MREIGETLAFLRQPEPPGGWREALEMLPLLKTVMAMRPRSVGRAPCQEVVLEGEAIDLARLPIQTCWPGEPAPLITWPLVVTQGPSHGRGGDKRDAYNLGIYRMQVIGRNRTYMRWLKHRGGAQQHHRWKETRSDPLPAAAVIGADPGTILAAVTPVPDTLSEYQFAGLLKGAKLDLVPCKTIPLQVPAEAEIVLEGHVSLEEYGDEGPYGDHTGYYNAIEPFPVFTISAITMRRDAIYLSTFTGRPPDEPSILGEALNEVFIPLLQQQFPEIVDFWLPPEGCSYRVAVVSMKKAYPGHAKRIMMAVWSYLRQFMYTKFVIVIDADLNARDWKDVIWAISTNVDAVARPDGDRWYADRLPRLRLAGLRPRRQARHRRHRETARRDQPRVGPPHPNDRRDHRGGEWQVASATACPAAASRSGVRGTAQLRSGAIFGQTFAEEYPRVRRVHGRR